MTALTRWNPFEEMEEMQNRLSSMLDWSPVRWTTDEAIEWTPLVDVFETNDDYVIRADLPGVSKDQLSVTLENADLTIKGSRSPEKLPEGAEYLINERYHGTFTRTFTLAPELDGSRITAEFKDGILTVRVPKNESAKPRVIEIKSE